MMTKCDLCKDYITQGKKPACVDSCPMRALDFGLYDDMIFKYGDCQKVYPLPDPELAKPGISITPHHDAKRAISENVSFIEREDI